MVKNQNWQRRVETADARRKAAKQRKQALQDKRQHKQWMQDFLATLQKLENNDELQEHVKSISIWSDQNPQAQVVVAAAADGDATQGSHGVLWDDDSNANYKNGKSSSNRRVVRAASMDSTLPVVHGASNMNSMARNDKKNRRGRSNSLSSEGNGEASRELRNEINLPPLLCASHFFQNKCAEATTKRSGSCGYAHYDCSYESDSKTLAQVVMGTTSKARQHQSHDLTLSLQAAEVSGQTMTTTTTTMSAPEGAMTMVYYSCFPVMVEQQQSSTDDQPLLPPTSLCQQVTDFLSQQARVSLSSVVYIVMEDVLVYDRNRQGLLVDNDNDLVIRICSSSGRKRDNSSSSLLRRKYSIGSSGSSHHHDVEAASGCPYDDDGQGRSSSLLLTTFPGEVLEHVLSFLPDAAVPAACLVCRTWHSELGQDASSPNLWRHMLERRQWPLPSLIRTTPIEEGESTAAAATENLRNAFRQEFIKHYVAIRDVAAIQSGLTAIQTRKRAVEKEMSYQDFSQRRHAPSSPNKCVSIFVWSPNHTIAAYSQDCTLRLFESSLKAGSSEEKTCREVVCQNIDPYRNTKKRNSCIMSMGLDDDYIGCLCYVDSDDQVDSHDLDMGEYNLVVLSRDDFLFGGDAPAGVASSVPFDPTVIDIGQAVLNFLVSSDVLDHGMLVLMDFVDQGRGLNEVEIFVTQTLVACGQGRFMVEVSISIPDDHDEDLLLFDRRLVLISAEIGAVLWIGDRNSVTQPPAPPHEDILLSYMTRSLRGLGSTCVVAVGSRSSSSVKVFQVFHTGLVDEIEEVCVPLSSVRDRVVQQDGGWHDAESLRQSILVTPTDVLVGDVVNRVVEDVVQERKAFVTFLPRHMSSELTCSTVALPGNIEVVRMARLRDEHAIVFCRTYAPASQGRPMAEPLGGHWLRNSQPTTDRVEIHALVFHVATRCQVGRFRLVNNVSKCLSYVPHITEDTSDTLGVALSCKGIVITGNDVRQAAGSTPYPNDSPPPQSGKKKKKKGSKSKREGKKDEFARGMRQSF